VFARKLWRFLGLELPHDPDDPLPAQEPATQPGQDKRYVCPQTRARVTDHTHSHTHTHTHTQDPAPQTNSDACRRRIRARPSGRVARVQSAAFGRGGAAEMCQSSLWYARHAHGTTHAHAHHRTRTRRQSCLHGSGGVGSDGGEQRQTGAGGGEHRVVQQDGRMVRPLRGQPPLPRPPAGPPHPALVPRPSHQQRTHA
jgi:hypothetical protein